MNHEGFSPRSVVAGLLAGFIALTLPQAVTGQVEKEKEKRAQQYESASHTEEIVPGTTLTETLEKNRTLSAFQLLVERAGIGEELDSYEGVTFLVPTNAAFAHVSESQVEGTRRARMIVKRHVLNDAFSVEDLRREATENKGQGSLRRPGELKAVGLSLQDGDLVVNGTARILEHDIRVGENIVHVISHVLMPPEDPMHKKP